MAYVSSQLNCESDGGVGGSQPRRWIMYGTDVHTDVDAADWISDGDAKGLQVNDVVTYVRTSGTPGATLHTVASVTAGGAATLTSAILA